MATDRTSAARSAGKRKYLIRDLRADGEREASKTPPRTDAAPDAAPPTPPTPPTPQKTRDEMIAEAAYYRAQRRGFVHGDPVRDWLEAEREIEARSEEETR